MMKRNYSLFKIAFVLAALCALLLPPTTFGQQLRICDGIGGCTYNGFSQSARDPDVRGPAQLTIDSQVGNEWTGVFTILGNTYSVRGDVDANGTVQFTTGRRGDVRGTGKLQDLTRGGALLLATYKLTSGDQGQVNFLRNFNQPPDPGPPDIAGSYRGTFENPLSLMRGAFEWMVQQDRTPTGAHGTGFRGQETIGTTMNDFVGTIDGQGNFVRISVSAGEFFVGGGKIESGHLKDYSANIPHSGREDLGGGQFRVHLLDGGVEQ